jgi:AcrR family transcriptional regulator
MRRSSAETREHVLRVARDLFYWRGIRATGVDTVAAEAGVAPTTLYRLFASKDELVAAYLEREAAGYREWLASAIADTTADPRDRILALFDALTEQVRPDDCRGCPFQIGMAELADPALPGRVHAVAVKAWTLDQLRALTEELLGPSAERTGAAMADHLMLIFEGVYASVLSLGAAGPPAEVRSLVEHLTYPYRRPAGRWQVDSPTSG